MDFLESLYSMDNFGIYLFVIIGILVLLFLIVLFFGKKDQKKRKALEEKLEQTKVSSQDTFAEVTPVTPVEVPAEKEEEKKEEPVVNKEENRSEVSTTSNAVLNSDLPSASIEPEKEEPKKEFDFDALADAINKELADMEKNMQEKNTEEVKKVDSKPIDLPQQITEPVHLQVEEKPEIPKEAPAEPKQKPVMPSVFSSVYVNREKEEPKVQEPKPAAPARPEIELPKMMDLPKKAGNEAEEKPILKEEKDDIIFR